MQTQGSQSCLPTNYAKSDANQLTVSNHASTKATLNFDLDAKGRKVESTSSTAFAKLSNSNNLDSKQRQVLAKDWTV